MTKRSLNQILDQIDEEIEKAEKELQRAKWRARQGEDTKLEQLETERAIAEWEMHKVVILSKLWGVPVEHDTGGHRVRNRPTAIRSYLGARAWESSASS